MEEDQQQDLPKDALAVKQVLDSMVGYFAHRTSFKQHCTPNVQQNVRYEPRVLHYLLDFTYNHVHATLQDADVRRVSHHHVT